jgi:hypothetical protein
MNIGDKMYCYNNITGNKKIYPILDITIGDYYIILDIINNIVCFLDDKDKDLWLNFDVNYDSKFSYNNFFLTIQETRKLKLNNIEKEKVE